MKSLISSTTSWKLLFRQLFALLAAESEYLYWCPQSTHSIPYNSYLTSLGLLLSFENSCWIAMFPKCKTWKLKEKSSSPLGPCHGTTHNMFDFLKVLLPHNLIDTVCYKVSRKSWLAFQGFQRCASKISCHVCLPQVHGCWNRNRK